MPDLYTFHPRRGNGLLFQLVLAVLLGVGAALGLERAARAEGGLPFLGYLFPSVVAITILAWVLYRSYALAIASYTIERGGIRLQWGLRIEDIPMNAVLWVRLATGLRQPLPLPRLRWPGSLVGQQRLSDGTKLEYLATQADQLVVIGTVECWFVVSPANPDNFLHTFRRLTELGTFVFVAPRSTRPAALLANFWGNVPARLLILTGFLLSVGLLVWVVLAVRDRDRIPFRFGPEGAPAEYAPAVRLMLLPVLNGIIFAVDLVLGLFFYRRNESQIAAYLLWICGVVTTLLFLGAVFFILRTP